MTNTKVQVEVYGFATPTVLKDVLNGVIAPSILNELKGPGAGNLSINIHDPKVANDPTLLAYRNIMKVKVGDTVIGAFVLGKKTTGIVQADAASEFYLISGETIKTWFNDAIVYPATALAPASADNRNFNFASPRGSWYNAANWSTPTNVVAYGDVVSSPWRYAPKDWPDAPLAQWVWSSSSVSQPSGDNYFRYEFTAPTASKYSFFFAADDSFDAYIDGQLTTSSALGALSWLNMTRIDADLTVGSHVFAVKVNNVAVGPAGLLAAVFVYGDPLIPTAAALLSYTGMTLAQATALQATALTAKNTSYAYWNSLSAGVAKDDAYLVYLNANLEYNTTALAVTEATAGSAWTVSGYPTIPPGWSPGEIMLTLLSEATARGVHFPSWLTPNFTATTDSNGVTWDRSLQWTFTVGTKYSEVVKKLEELACDVWIDPSTYTLNMATSRGVDRSIYQGPANAPTSVPVIFEKGKNLLQSSIDGLADITNSLIVKSVDGWFSQQDVAGSIATYGNIEAMLSTGVSKSVSTSVASTVFTQKANPEQGASYVIAVVPGSVPFVDFNPGDWVLAPNDVGLGVKRRVMTITTTANATGDALYVVEFDTIFQDNQIKISQWVSKMSGGALGGQFANAGSGSSSPVGEPVVTTSHTQPSPKVPVIPVNVAISSVGNWYSNGVTPYSEVTMTWDAVTTNTDGTTTVPYQYEVWGKLTSDSTNAYVRYATVVANTATFRPFTPGTQWTFEVRALNGGLNIPTTYSGFSATINHTMVAPSTAMSAPDTPVLTTNKGVLIVTWNGLLGGLAPPPQFRYVYAAVAPDVSGSAGTYIKTGPSLARDGRTINISGLTVGSKYYVKLIAVDGINIVSPDSTVANIILSGIDLVDLGSTVSAAITAADNAAYEAKALSNLVFDPGFEANDPTIWSLETANVTNVTTTPRSGLRAMSVMASTVAYVASRYQHIIPVDDLQTYIISGWVRALGAGATVDQGVSIGIEYGTTIALGSVADVAVSSASLAATYTQISGVWSVPAGTRFARIVLKTLLDTSNVNTYLFDDLVFLQQISNSVIVNGAITAAKIGAGEVVAGKLAAGSVAASNIQAGAIAAGKIAAGTVTANEIAANTITGNNIAAGTVTATNLRADVGGALDISANSSVNILVGDINSVLSNLNATNGSLATMQTYYQFGAGGATISSPSSPYSIHISSSQIQILQLGVVVSYWSAGQMYVDQFVGTTVTLGNHQIKKYTTGTIVQAL